MYSCILGGLFGFKKDNESGVDSPFRIAVVMVAKHCLQAAKCVHKSSHMSYRVRNHASDSRPFRLAGKRPARLWCRKSQCFCDRPYAANQDGSRSGGGRCAPARFNLQKMVEANENLSLTLVQNG